MAAAEPAEPAYPLRAGAPILIEAAIAESKDFDHGDVVQVRFGLQGYFQSFWVPRELLILDPEREKKPMK